MLLNKVDIAVPIRDGLVVDSPKHCMRNFKGSASRVEFNSEAILPRPFLFSFRQPEAVEEELTSVSSGNWALCRVHMQVIFNLVNSWSSEWFKLVDG